MKKKKIYQIILGIIVVISGCYLFINRDPYYFNKVSEIQLEVYIDSEPKDENFKKIYFTIQDKTQIRNLTKSLKDWKFKPKELESKIYKINYFIQMNNGFTISFDSNFSKESCYVTLNNKAHDGCVPDSFMNQIKEIIHQNT